jgi:two-component system, LytTR family, sensor kinase
MIEEILEKAKNSLEMHFGSKKTTLLVWLNATYLVLCPLFLYGEKVATGEYIHSDGIGYVYAFVALVNFISLCFNVYQLKNYKLDIIAPKLRQEKLEQIETILTYSSLASLMVMSICNMVGYGNPSNDSLMVDFSLACSLIFLTSVLINRNIAIGWTVIVIICLTFISFKHGMGYQFDFLTPSESISYHKSLDNLDPVALARRDELSIHHLNSPKVSRYFWEWFIIIFVSIVSAFYFNGKTSKMFEIFPKVTDDLKKAMAYAAEESRLKLEVTEDNAKLNEELFHSEINFLKAQINPHFIFNALNNLYGKLLENAPESASLALKISEMMRYSVDSTTTVTVDLDKELEAIKCFLDLQEARFIDDYNVFYSLIIEKNNFKLPPLILLTLIENAFKFGILNKEDEPIKIFIKTVKNRLFFECSNLILIKSVEKSTTSIRLQNLKKRLDRFNNGDYILDYKEEDGRFNVKLELGLIG